MHDNAERTDDTSGDVRGWFTGRLPQDWFTAAGRVTVDREEITVVGTCPPPESADGARTPSGRPRPTAGPGPSARTTRDQRIAIAREAEHRFDRKVAWGVEVAAAGCCSRTSPCR